MEEIQAARAEAITPLAELLEERGELQRQLAALDEPYGRPFANAEAAGWSTEELVAMGAEEPLKRPKGRPRGKRSAPKRPAVESASSTPQSSAPTAAVPAQDSAGDATAAPAGNVSG